jgi:microcystin-dependent protein
MALESGTYLNSLVTSNPTATDALAQADDHLRLIKSVLVNTFPNLAGAVSVTQGELNVIDGSTSATSVTLVNADTVVINDGGTMVQVALTDLLTYINAGITLRDDVVTTASLGDAVVGTANIIDASITNDKIAAGAISASKISADVSFASGMVMPYAGSTGAPTGWLLCYGQLVSRTTYADLYTAIGTTYGVGDGVTTFALPDLRGRVVAGQDDMGGASANRLTSALNGDTLGATGGTEDVTLTAAQSGLPAHTHSINLVTVKPNAGTGSAKTGYYYDSFGGSGQDGSPSLQTTRTETTNSNTTQDASSSHTNVQPTAILNYIIKT